MSALSETLLPNNFVYIGCSFLAFVVIAAWIFLKVKRNGRLRHEEFNLDIPPSVMQKAPPPTLPDAIRLLPKKVDVDTKLEAILNISGGIPTLNERSKAFEKVMRDLSSSTPFYDERLMQSLVNDKTLDKSYSKNTIVFIPPASIHDTAAVNM